MRRSVTTLDPRNPLVLDTRALGRRAGSMSRVSRTVPAPAELGTMGLTVPEGSDVALDLRLESVIEGVLVSGSARVRVEGECSRCLDPVTDEVTVDVSELYVYPETDARGRVVRPAAGDTDTVDDEPTVEDDLIDLVPTLRDAVVLELPIAPVCRESCPGLCPQCGYRLADDPEHHHDQVDARWAALAGMLDTQAVASRGDDRPHIDKEEG